MPGMGMTQAQQSMAQAQQMPGMGVTQAQQPAMTQAQQMPTAAAAGRVGALGQVGVGATSYFRVEAAPPGVGGQQQASVLVPPLPVSRLTVDD